jgi:hypothetical protein
MHRMLIHCLCISHAGPSHAVPGLYWLSDWVSQTSAAGAAAVERVKVLQGPNRATCTCWRYEKNPEDLDERFYSRKSGNPAAKDLNDRVRMLAACSSTVCVKCKERLVTMRCFLSCWCITTLRTVFWGQWFMSRSLETVQMLMPNSVSPQPGALFVTIDTSRISLGCWCQVVSGCYCHTAV